LRTGIEKDFSQCEVVLKKILTHEQNHLEANLNLGRVYSNLSKFDAAIDQYNIVLKFDKSYFVPIDKGNKVVKIKK